MNIVTDNVDKFNALSRLVEKLPEIVRNQIDEVRTGTCDIHCKLRVGYGEKQMFYLPNETTQIHDFGDYIGVYCGRFFFEIYKKDKMTFNYSILKSDAK